MKGDEHFLILCDFKNTKPKKCWYLNKNMCINVLIFFNVGQLDFTVFLMGQGKYAEYSYDECSNDECLNAELPYNEQSL